MGDYTRIADVGNALTTILRKDLVPEIIRSEDLIGLCSPSDKGDVSLGIYLYDIRQSEGVQSHDMIALSANRQKYPSSYYTLYYMLTAYSNSDLKFRSEEEQKILGRVLQILNDNKVLDAKTLEIKEELGSMDLRIESLSLNSDEKLKLWNMPSVPYRLSVFYKIYPIEIESTKIRNIRRVTEVDFAVKEI